MQRPLPRSSVFRPRQRLDDVDHVAERAHGPGAIVGDGDAELFLDGEEDGQSVEGIDPRVGERRLRPEQILGDVLLLPDDGNELLLDLAARHGPYDSSVVRRLFPWFYVAWIAFCALLFLALSGLEDPSRPKGRILSTDAGRRALAIARDRGMQDYEVVHVARARKGEGAAEDRWVVLLDKVPHTKLRQAVVIELRASDGSMLRVRSPES